MHPSTPALKVALESEPDMRRRFDLLRGAYQGETAFVFSCGPSFDAAEVERLRSQLKGRLVIAIKQSYHTLGALSDFHLVNAVNLSRYRRHRDTITCMEYSFVEPESSVRDSRETLVCQVDKALEPLSGPEQYARWLVRKRNFADYTFDKSLSRPWGPSILIELGLYLFAHLGVQRVVCVGWDVSPPDKSTQKMTHFYERRRLKQWSLKKFEALYEKILWRCPSKLKPRLAPFTEWLNYTLGEVTNKVSVCEGENEAIWDASEAIYRYFLGEGMEIQLASSVSHLSPAIPRTTLEMALAADPTQNERDLR